MATIVYRGLQSCLESQLAESRTLRLKLSSSKPHFSQPLELALKSCFLDSNFTKEAGDKCHNEEISKKTNFLYDKHCSSNPDMGGWSFLQAISNSSQASKEAIKEENTYVHPLTKRSSSTLSQKSLELCTENLGNETGTDIIEDSIFSLSTSDMKSGNSSTRSQSKSWQLSEVRKAKAKAKVKANSPSFPPPLTTIRGSESLQVRPHREDGRLVIKVVKAPSMHTCFQAERSNGRLRLCFWKDADFEEVATEENEVTDEDNKREELENDVNCEEEEEELEEEEKVEYEQENDAYLDEEMDDNSLDVVAEMGMEKFQRPGRCKDGEHENKGLLNWEPFWVATS